MVEDLYQGEHNSDEDFAYQLADDMGLVPEGSDWPTSYIDWSAAARDLMMDYGESVVRRALWASRLMLNETADSLLTSSPDRGSSPHPFTAHGLTSSRAHGSRFTCSG
jgi:hypothetical protein